MIKRICAFATCLLSLTATGQFKIKTEIFESGTWKGTLNGKKITLHVENWEVFDCRRYDVYLSGWYQLDGQNQQTPLDGYSQSCQMVLYHFGKQNQDSKELLLSSMSDTDDNDFLKTLAYEECFRFDRCNPSDKQNGIWAGTFDKGEKKQTIQLIAKDLFLGLEHQYLILPNKKQIHLNDIFPEGAGNKYISSFVGKEEERVLLYFHHESNSNACGFCGASEGETGYRIIHLNKDMTIKKIEEVLTESCIQNIYETKTLEKSSRFHRYKVGESSSDPAYYLTIDIANATIRKSGKK